MASNYQSLKNLADFEPSRLNIIDPKDGNNNTTYSDFTYTYPNGKVFKLECMGPRLSTDLLKLEKNQFGKIVLSCLTRYQHDNKDHMELVKFYDTLYDRIIELILEKADKFGWKEIKATLKGGKVVVPGQDVESQVRTAFPQRFYMTPTDTDGNEDLTKPYSGFVRFIYNTENKSKPGSPPYISPAFTSAKLPTTMDKFVDKAIEFTPTFSLGRAVKATNSGIHLDAKTARIWKISDPVVKNPYADVEGEEDESVKHFSPSRMAPTSRSAFDDEEEAESVSSATMLDVPA